MQLTRFSPILWVFFCCFITVKCAKPSSICYKCASAPIALNWRSYMPSIAGSDFEVDKKCTNITSNDNTVGCRGPCMTLRVSGQYKGNERFFGTMRDCYSNYYKTPKTLTSQPECITKIVTIKGKKYTAEYCYCDGSYCNGPAPSGPRKRKFTSSNGNSSIFNFISFLTFFFVFC